MSDKSRGTVQLRLITIPVKESFIALIFYCFAGTDDKTSEQSYKKLFIKNKSTVDL